MPKLTVILPVYNREKYVADAIESVLQQDFEDFEFIIINDGSTDKTDEIINKFTDKRIQYIKQENAGEYATTNRGIKMSKTPFVSWVHSDDILAPGSLRARIECLEQHPDIEIVHGDLEVRDMDGDKLDYLPAGGDDGPQSFKRYCQDEHERTNERYFVNYQTFMFHREIMERTGYLDEKLIYGGDLDWMLRVLKTCHIMRVSQLVYIYRRHNETITKVVKREGMDTDKMTKTIQERYCNL